MKLTHKLCGATLVALAGVALAAPNTTKAVEDTGSGAGTIKFTIGTDTKDVLPTEPGVSDGTKITNIPDVKNPGEFGIIAVTPLDFDSHDSLTASKKRDYNALPFAANAGSVDADAPEFQVQNFVKYQDLRAVATHNYKLSAELTENFKTATGIELNGANINYTSVYTTQTGDAVLDPDGVKNAGGTISVGSPVEFINNSGVNGKGYGQFELNFGKVGDAVQPAESAVTLNIPTSTAIGTGDYQATITWTLSDVI
ncbi:hypothetical protein A5881_002317 [Enterococcus termitis]|nr:hypothetical protein A5881_001365 [Enterococcus termitis]